MNDMLYLTCNCGACVGLRVVALVIIGMLIVTTGFLIGEIRK